MSEPAIRCPLCKRVVKIVVHPTNYSGRAVEEHPYDGGLAEFVSYLLDSQVKWSARCPMSGASTEKKS